jgi:hypothetical protein
MLGHRASLSRSHLLRRFSLAGGTGQVTERCLLDTIAPGSTHPSHAPLMILGSSLFLFLCQPLNKYFSHSFYLLHARLPLMEWSLPGHVPQFRH